jgi:hypothetical protein
VSARAGARAAAVRDADLPLEPLLVRFGAADRHLEPVITEAQVADIERDELGTPAAARESEADQGSISDVARVVSPHR